MSKDYTIGIYIRLSMADEDTGSGNKAESDSIGNQRMLINRYLDNHPTLSKYPRLEFADDGYTGTNFHRPQFTAMMEKVRHGEINLICVKDFSRFSRDYIETGNYLECTFPFMGVRFISINDGYDSDDYKGTTGGLEVVMRSIIYAAYSKDLSVKTTTAKIQMMKQGKYVGGYAPYGYVLHPEIRNKLKLDPEAAEVVRRVFDEALEGRNTSQIALGLNDDNIPTPGQYFKGKHPDKKKFSRMSEKISWTASMVYKLLTSYVYTGATVGHKRKSGGVGSRKTISQEKEDWIIVEGMHEAIVSKEEFELAQAVIRGGERIPNGTRTITHSKALCAAATANAPLPGASSGMRADISTSVPTRRMTAIRSVRLARGTARHGLRTRHTMRLGKCLRWSKRKQSKNTRSASGENLLSQNVPIQSAICKSSLNSSRESSSGCMRSTLRPASQRRNISSEKLRWTPR